MLIEQITRVVLLYEHEHIIPPPNLTPPAEAVESIILAIATAAVPISLSFSSSSPSHHLALTAETNPKLSLCWKRFLGFVEAEIPEFNFEATVKWR